MFVVRLVILELAIAVLRFYVLDSLRPEGDKLLNILQSVSENGLLFVMF